MIGMTVWVLPSDKLLDAIDQEKLQVIQLYLSCLEFYNLHLHVSLLI